MYIVVREPLRNYRDPEVFAQLEDAGRALPIKWIRLTTLITPDIANPNGRRCRWPRAPRRSGFAWAAVPVPATISDSRPWPKTSAATAIDFTASLVFVPFSEITGDTPGATITFGPAAFRSSKRPTTPAAPTAMRSTGPAVHDGAGNGKADNTTR